MYLNFVQGTYHVISCMHNDNLACICVSVCEQGLSRISRKPLEVEDWF